MKAPRSTLMKKIRANKDYNQKFFDEIIKYPHTNYNKHIEINNK